MAKLVKQLADDSPKLDVILRGSPEWREVLTAAESDSGS